jgi:hypothetical protein
MMKQMTNAGGNISFSIRTRKRNYGTNGNNGTNGKETWEHLLRGFLPSNSASTFPFVPLFPFVP